MISYLAILNCVSISLLEVGAIVFDPARTTIPVRLVNSFETRDVNTIYIFNILCKFLICFFKIYLENVSDSDVNYRLQYREEFTADSASRIVERTVSELMDLIAMPSFDDELQNGKKKSGDSADSLSKVGLIVS